MYRSWFKTNPNLYNALIICGEIPQNPHLYQLWSSPKWVHLNDPWPSQEKLPGLNSKVWREDFTPINGRNGMGNWGNTPYYKWSYGALNFQCLYVTLRHPSFTQFTQCEVRYEWTPKKTYRLITHRNETLQEVWFLDVRGWFQGGQISRLDPSRSLFMSSYVTLFSWSKHFIGFSLGLFSPTFSWSLWGPLLSPTYNWFSGTHLIKGLWSPPWSLFA